MRLSTIHDFFKEVDFKFSLCFVKRNKLVNAKSLSMLLIIILTIGCSHEMITKFAVWADRPKGRYFTLDRGLRERPSPISWLLLLPLLLGSLLSAAGIVAKRGELLMPLAVMMLLYTPLLFHSIYAMQQKQALDPRMLVLFSFGSVLVVLHCIFILLAAKNEIDREVDEVFSIGKSMEFSETEVGFIRHYS